MNLLFDDTYTGPRYRYGLTIRPLARFNVPDGWIIQSDRPHKDFPRYGTVAYPFPLTEEQMHHYDMVEVKE